MKKLTVAFISLSLCSCASLKLHEQQTFDFSSPVTLKGSISKATEIEKQYLEITRKNYDELVTLDQFLLHSALVGVIGVASSAHTDVLTTAGVFGGYVGAQKAYAGPLGKAKLYLEGAAAVQCVQRHTGQLLPFVEDLQEDFKLKQLKVDLANELRSLKALNEKIEGYEQTFTGADKTLFSASLNSMSLGNFDSLNGVQNYGFERLEDVKATIVDVDNLPYLVFKKLQEIDMEVTRRFITETVDINTVIATLKQIQTAEPETPQEQVDEDVNVSLPQSEEEQKSETLAPAYKDLGEAVEVAKKVLQLSNKYTTKDLSLLTSSTASIKACVVATVQATD
jgi:hypothetical protein